MTNDVLQHQIEANKRKVLAVLAVSAGAVFLAIWIVLAVVGFALAGVLVAALAAGGATALLQSGATDAAVRRSRGELADPHVHARLHNVVEGLCVAAGVPKPVLYVVDDDAPNAFAAGRDARRAAIVVTRGLLDKLTRLELEGVLAHELSHVKNHDIAVSTLAAAVPGALAPNLVSKVVGDRRETLADVTGVSFTRYPPGLISALEKLREDPSVLRSPHRAIAHLWIEAPVADAPRPPLDERIQALREL